MSTDTRVAYGAQCTWWGDISDVGLKESRGYGGFMKLPCCPHCKGVLYEKPTEKDFLEPAADYEKTKPHPGYVDMIKWAKGRCFPGFRYLIEAYDRRDA